MKMENEIMSENEEENKNENEMKRYFVVLIHMHSHTIVQKHKQLTHPPSPPHNLTLAVIDSLNNNINCQKKITHPP